MTRTWTIFVNDVSRKYKTIDFERKLEKNSPTRFEAVIEYISISYFALVEIKRDGVVEWKGFVEKKEEFWDSTGRYLHISGRDTTVILWKKFSENFVNFQPDTSGFFGNVNANELIKFLLRTPKSDPIHLYPNNKEGWGIDAGRIQDCSAYRTSIGDAKWVKLRRRGYGWRNTGSPFNSINCDVDGVISNSWSTQGASPYLDAEDDGNYIYSQTNGQTGIFSFENLSTLDATATGVNSCYLTVVWRPDQTWWWWITASAEAWISVDGGTTWYFAGVFGGRESPFNPNPWRRYTFDVSDVVDTVAKVDAMRVKFICTSSGLNMNITHTYLAISYITSGSQSTRDYFDIPFESDTIMGCYVESRIDNDSYPRNYAVYKVESSQQDFSAYTQTDPNGHIGVVGTNHIDFDCYKNEDAYIYKDFGADYFSLFLKHTIEIKPVTDPIPEPDDATGIMAGFYCLCNDLDDLWGLIAGSKNFIGLYIWKDPDDIINGGEPCFVLREQNGAIGNWTYSGILDEGKTYTFEIERSLSSITVTIYEDGVYWETLTRTMGGASNKFRYLMAGITPNTGVNVHTDVDIEDLVIEVETELVSVSDNTYRDIIHSWTPETMSGIRIRITSPTADKSWAISQVYIYKAESLDYRVWKETGSPSFPDEQYIRDFSADTTYNVAIGPLNIPRGRLLDTINTVVGICHESYIPYEWWLALDLNNTFHVKSQKGSDLSGSISFLKGTNLGNVSKSGDVSDTVQRIQLVGRGEGKRQEEISSSWQEDTGEMANVNTFFEDIISDKTVGDKNVADLLANIQLTSEAPPKVELVIEVNKDSYTSMDYDYGDYVTITDSLTSTSGSHRLYNIKKSVDDGGEHITLYIDEPRREVEDEWQKIYDRLKALDLIGVIAADWTGEAGGEGEVDVQKVTTFFEKTAKNDENAEREIQDPSWYLDPDPTAYTARTGHVPPATPAPEFYDFSNGKKWKHESDWMSVQGADSGTGVDTLLIELRGPTGETFDIPMSQNPKFVCEMKVFNNPPQDWRNGDYFDIGLYDASTSKGYYFRIIKESGIINCYVRWNETGVVGDVQSKIVRILDVNTKYRFEIITDSDFGVVIFNVYDLDIDQKYPPSVIATNITLTNTVRPLSMLMSSDHNNEASNIAVIYIYKFRTEWEKIQ